jgi:hypothetical protein
MKISVFRRIFSVTLVVNTFQFRAFSTKSFDRHSSFVKSTRLHAASIKHFPKTLTSGVGARQQSSSAFSLTSVEDPMQTKKKYGKGSGKPLRASFGVVGLSGKPLMRRLSAHSCGRRYSLHSGGPPGSRQPQHSCGRRACLKAGDDSKV